jgi:hypothetical protein
MTLDSVMVLLCKVLDVRRDDFKYAQSDNTIQIQMYKIYIYSRLLVFFLNDDIYTIKVFNIISTYYCGYRTKPYRD